MTQIIEIIERPPVWSPPPMELGIRRPGAGADRRNQVRGIGNGFSGGGAPAVSSWGLVPAAGVGTVPAPDALWWLDLDGVDQSVNALTVSGTINSNQLGPIPAEAGYTQMVPHFPSNTILSRANADVSVIQTHLDVTIAQLIRPIVGIGTYSYTMQQWDGVAATASYTLGLRGTLGLPIPFMGWGAATLVYAELADSFTGTDYMVAPFYQWSWVVARRASGANSVATFWVNGVKSDDTTPAANSTGVVGAEIHIGRSANSGTQDFNGQISQSMIWTSALSDAQVDELNAHVLP